MIRLLLIVVACAVLGGCSARQIGWVDYAGDVAKATANGFVTGGPIGGLVGLIAGLIPARRANKRAERRERIVQIYRARNGDLSEHDYEMVTGKPPRRPKKPKNQEIPHVAHP